MAYRIEATLETGSVRSGGKEPVLLHVCVTDENGRGVPNLHKRDFRVVDFGADQPEGLYKPATDFVIEQVKRLEPIGDTEFDREAISGYYSIRFHPKDDEKWWPRKTIGITVQILLGIVAPHLPLTPGEHEGGANYAYCHALIAMELPPP